ncbi:MAG: 50S ribosomal protein L1 [Thermoplasmata archaeon]
MAERNTIEAVRKAIETSKQRNFEESVEIAVNLKDLDLSLPKNRIEEEILLPKGRGKPVKIAIFATGELAVKARDAADMIFGPEDIEDLAENKRKARKIAETIDFFLAEAPLMPTIGKRLGVILAPRGKMPKPIPPGADPGPMIETMKKTVRIRTKDRRTFHAPVGTKSMSLEDLADNVDEIMKRLISRLERGKENIESAYVKTTMGPAVKII